MMSTDQVLIGVGLILVLAVGSQVLASQLRIPALIILLPAGFTVGALTTDVNPEHPLGTAFQPLVSLAVAVILYDSGLALEWGKVRGRAPSDGQRTQIEHAGLELVPGERLAAAVAQGAGFEGVTAVLLLTGEDGYNALGATMLAGNSATPIYRLPPSQSGVVTSSTPGEALFTPTLIHPALTSRHTAGAGIIAQASDGGINKAADLLFRVNPNGTLIPVTLSHPPDLQPGDTLVLLDADNAERRSNDGSCAS
jgi:hypothetical protein